MQGIALALWDEFWHCSHLNILLNINQGKIYPKSIVEVEQNKDQTNYFVYMFYLFLILC